MPPQIVLSILIVVAQLPAGPGRQCFPAFASPLFSQTYLQFLPSDPTMSAGPILSQLWCSFWAQLVKLPQYLSQLFCGLLHRGQSGHGSRGPLSSTSAERAKELLFSPDELIPGGQLHKSTPYPLTPQQVENSIEAFIASINKSAICALASRHNGGKSCRIIDQRNGSFNICFFVLFDAEDVKWVVRIPIEPVISNTWAKVVSEITTIKYVFSLLFFARRVGY